MNKHDFHIGNAFNAYEFFGAHITDKGVVFRTYAPCAEEVFVIGEFNGWQGQEMVKDKHGIFTFTAKNAKAGQMYKYRIPKPDGRVIDHCDPYGFGMELRPASASYIVDLTQYKFTDSEWMNSRSKNHRSPLNIYEVHLGSWKTNPEDENGWFNYKEIAEKLVPYVKEQGYTHLEIMPLNEHPSDESWGYQGTGFFSPTSRYGTAAQLMAFVNLCHINGIGVIMDFVPVHFAVDDYALNTYDGEALYEYPHKDIGVSEWGSLNFIHSRGEVASFLQSAANYWLEEFHFDGIRMDAISRAIYWQGNPARGVNSTAIDFIKKMNTGLQQRHPSAMLFAEDSTSFPQVSAPTQYGGLGFDYKWDLGWMNDTLDYFAKPPAERPVHYHKLTFSMQYFYNELYVLPLSHDEVVHGKKTIVDKMWGSYEEKFAQCRALYMYMYAHPGKKLNFMGNEIAQFREWDEKREQDWDILAYPMHSAFNKYIKTLNKIYLQNPPLFFEDYNPNNFHWLEVNAPDKCVYIFERIAKGKHIIAAFNFSAIAQSSYEVAVGEPMALKKLICSESEQWGGTYKDKAAKITAKAKGGKHVLKLDLPAFSGQLYLREDI